MRKQEQKGKITALYERLSHDDGRSDESVSVENQKRILEDYARKNGFTNVRHFTDDGVRGTTFKRPGLDAMVDEIRAGNVATVIVKDQSRIGRDVVEVGLLKRTFDEYNVRFIAANDNLDTANGFDIMSIFRDVINEWYVADTSRKIKTVFKSRMEKGLRCSGAVPYGYLASKEEKGEWVIDEEAAAVVRRIFQMVMDGQSVNGIARTLRAEQIPIPSEHWKRIGCPVRANSYRDPYAWSATTLGYILKRPEYLGRKVLGKTVCENYKTKSTRRTMPEEQFVFEGAVPAIIDEETWHNVQRLRETKRRTPKRSNAPNRLTGLLYCADCGAKLTHHNSLVQGKYIDDAFTCSRYRAPMEDCTIHYVATQKLEAAILSAIQRISWYVRNNEQEFVQRVRKASSLRQEEAVKDCRKQIVQASLDLLPTVHEGVAVRQMEAKGIPTDKGDLNRWIKKANNILRDIRKKIAGLTDWIKAIKEELSKPQAPTLAALLTDYYEGRNAGAWSRNARIGNLKGFAEAINFLTERGIATLEDLETHIAAQSERTEAINTSMKAKRDRLNELKELLRLVDLYRDTKPVYDELQGIKWKGKREKFEREHENELRTFHMARRKLDKHRSPAGKIPVHAWEQEQARLHQEYTAEYEQYKPIQDDLRRLQQVKRNADAAIHQQEQTQQKRREVER